MSRHMRVAWDGAIVFGETDAARESADPDSGREILVAASDVAGCIWSASFAELCAVGLSHDLKTARDRGIPIVVLGLPGAPPVPAGLFPTGTRAVDLPADPRAAAAIIARIHHQGHEWMKLLEAPNRPERTES